MRCISPCSSTRSDLIGVNGIAKYRNGQLHIPVKSVMEKKGSDASLQNLPVFDRCEINKVLNRSFARLQVIRTFARHYKTGKTLDDDVINSLVLAKRMFAASVSERIQLQ